MAVKVLHVLNGMGHGGAEAFIMNMYRNIDRNKVHFDFLVRSVDNSKYEEEVRRLGGRIFVTAPFPQKILKNYIETRRFFEQHRDYDIIHVHANSLLYLLPLKLAKKHDIKCRIIHSHSTRSAKKIHRFIHNFNKKRIEKYATDFFACSVSAGKWMFSQNFHVIKNAINTNNFLFNHNTRNKMRNKLNVVDNLVIGHVGRFAYPKNHKFILSIFKEILAHNSNAVLILVGNGELYMEMHERAKLLKIEDNIIFCGNKDNVNEYLNAFDIFVFPSFFEGLGIALIEAQATGLQCVVSDRIEDEAIITENVFKLSLDEQPNEWAKAILRLANKERKNMSQEIINAGYDMNSAMKKMEDFYLQYLGK